MRKYIHREVSKDSEIDPMNAPTRTVFFKKNKPIQNNEETEKSSKKNQNL